MRSPSTGPASSRASRVTSNCTRVTQCTATARGRAAATTAARSPGAGRVVSSSSTFTGAWPTPITTRRCGSTDSRSRRPFSGCGSALVHPVIPYAAARSPTLTRSSRTGGTNPLSRSSSRQNRPSALWIPAARNAALFHTHSAPPRCCTRTGRSGAIPSSTHRSSSPATLWWYPTARTHSPGPPLRSAAANPSGPRTSAGPTRTDVASAASDARCTWWSCSPGSRAPPRPSTSLRPANRGPISATWPPVTRTSTRPCPSTSTSVISTSSAVGE